MSVDALLIGTADSLFSQLVITSNKKYSTKKKKFYMSVDVLAFGSVCVDKLAEHVLLFRDH